MENKLQIIVKESGPVVDLSSNWQNSNGIRH